MSNPTVTINTAQLTATDLTEGTQDDSSTSYQWRCTRNEMYPQGTIGYSDLSSRVGHYVYAYTWFDAMVQMINMFPHDVAGFTVTRA